jgi:hypothetical protein
VPIVSFERMNMKGRSVRDFRVLLVALLAGYVVGLGLYLANPTIHPMAASHFAASVNFVVAAGLLTVFMILLQWHILRTLILAFGLLGLAHLYCAIVVLQFESRLAHSLGLGGLAVLFAALFVARSNLLIYIRDKTYLDIAVETVVAVAFLWTIGHMILATLRAV